MKKVSKTSHHSFPVLIEESKDGFYAECPTLEACYTQGSSYEEVIKNIKEVIGLCVKTSTPKTI